MRNTFLEPDNDDELAFNKLDLTNLATEIGYPSETISFMDSKDLLVELGNNFIEEVLDCVKQLNITGGRPNLNHVKKALRLRFGVEVGAPIENYDTIKLRNMESDKIDEKLTK